MDKQRVYALLKREEGPKLDFKEKLDLLFESGKKELAKDIIAIGNSQGGRGYLLIGIRDRTKEVIGINPNEYKEETIQQILSLRCDPPLTIRVENLEVEDKYVCLITIFRSFQKPHQMRQSGAFYIRRGSTTDVARRDEIASMLQYNGLINNEQIPLFNMDLDVYEKDLVNKYLSKINLEGEVDNLPLLTNLGIIHYDKDSDTYVPTLGGILIFSQNPQRYLPHTGIRIVNRLEDQPKTIHLSGNVFQLVDQVIAYAEGLSGTYPIEAIEECVLNAIVHRDYFDTSRDILINFGYRKITFSNPGSMYGQDRIQNLKAEGNPRRRNIWLYNILLILDDKKRFVKLGTGLSYIESFFKDTSSVKFINIRKSNLFKVVLPGLQNYLDE